LLREITASRSANQTRAMIRLVSIGSMDTMITRASGRRLITQWSTYEIRPRTTHGGEGMKTVMSARDILHTGIEMFADNPELLTVKNALALRMAASLKWQQEEMGGVEHAQFAYRNDTPIVPPTHECHPINLVKRGFIDGEGWPKKDNKPNIKLFRWPDGKHWYASIDGKDVSENGRVKWNTAQQAEDAALRFAKRKANP
jgi:hypothetical protein